MKNKIFIILFLLGLFYAYPVKTQELPKIVTVNTIIQNISEKFEKIKTLKSQIDITIKQGNNEKKMRGTLKYKNPETFIIFFSQPKDQIIYSDGKTLKIYVPELNILGEQRLESKYASTFFITDKSSFYYLKNKYDFSFAKSNKPEIINNNPYYVLLLEPKERAVEFKKIKLYISPYWLIVKVEAESFTGAITTVNFYDIYINQKLTDYEFQFTLPVNVQTVVDPFTFSRLK